MDEAQETVAEVKDQCSVCLDPKSNGSNVDSDSIIEETVLVTPDTAKSTKENFTSLHLEEDVVMEESSDAISTETVNAGIIKDSKMSSDKLEILQDVPVNDLENINLVINQDNSERKESSEKIENFEKNNVKVKNEKKIISEFGSLKEISDEIKPDLEESSTKGESSFKTAECLNDENIVSSKSDIDDAIIIPINSPDSIKKPEEKNLDIIAACVDNNEILDTPVENAPSPMEVQEIVKDDQKKENQQAKSSKELMENEPERMECEDEPPSIIEAADTEVRSQTATDNSEQNEENNPTVFSDKNSSEKVYSHENSPVAPSVTKNSEEDVFMDEDSCDQTVLRKPEPVSQIREETLAEDPRIDSQDSMVSSTILPLMSASSQLSSKVDDNSDSMVGASNDESNLTDTKDKEEPELSEEDQKEEDEQKDEEEDEESSAKKPKRKKKPRRSMFARPKRNNKKEKGISLSSFLSFIINVWVLYFTHHLKTNCQ